MNKLIEIYNNRPIRLYLIEADTLKKTGKKRDYATVELFLKYSIETFKRYNRETYYDNSPTNTRALVCFMSEIGKWQEIPNELILKHIGDEYLRKHI